MSANQVPVTLVLYIPFGGHWKESLEIPMADVTRMSAKPLKWLRFLSYLIINSTGHLYSDMAAADIQEAGAEVDYDSLVIGPEYYYLPDNEDDKYHAADLAGLKTQGCTSARGALSSRPGYTDFVNAVDSRDGEVCRFTGIDRPSQLQKAHIIPRSKGFQHIEKLVNPRASPGQDELTSIDDVRNGITLYISLHVAQGAGHLSFLRVPNLYMSEDDIIRNNQPLSPVHDGEEYLILHWLNISERLPFLPEHNSPAQRPTTQQEMDDWPVAVIVDFMYACAAIRNWGTSALRSSLEQQHESNNPATWELEQQMETARAEAEKKGQITSALSKRAEERLKRFDNAGGSGQKDDDDGWVWYMDGLMEFQIARQTKRVLVESERKAALWLDNIEASSSVTHYQRSPSPS